MKKQILSICAILAVSQSLIAMDMSPCEQKATAVPDDTWSQKEWKEHKAAVKRWKEKKGADRYNPKNPQTNAYRVPGENTSFKELEALEESNKRHRQNLSEQEKIAYQTPSDNWTNQEWKAYRDARKSLGLDD